MPVIRVHRSSVDPDEDLVVFRHRFRNVHDLEDLGGAVVAIDDGFHEIAFGVGQLLTVIARGPVGELETNDADDEEDEEGPFEDAFYFHRAVLS